MPFAFYLLFDRSSIGSLSHARRTAKKNDFRDGLVIVSREEEIRL